MKIYISRWYKIHMTMHQPHMQIMTLKGQSSGSQQGYIGTVIGTARDRYISYIEPYKNINCFLDTSCDTLSDKTIKT